MHYREARTSDCRDIRGLSIDELGWTSSNLDLQDTLGKYPGAVAVNGEGVCGFVYAKPLSSDMLRISNMVVSSEHRNRGVGEQLLRLLDKQARQAGYEALLFPEDSNWFDEESLQWIHSQGFQSVFDTDQTKLLVRETF